MPVYFISCREYCCCCYCHSCCHTSRCSNCYWWYIYVPKVKVSSFEFITVTTLQLKVNPKPFFFFCWVPALTNQEWHCTCSIWSSWSYAHFM